MGKAERQVGEHFRLANVWHGWSRLVMLSAAKHLVPHRVRSFALLRMTSEADGSAVAPTGGEINIMGNYECPDSLDDHHNRSPQPVLLQAINAI